MELEKAQSIIDGYAEWWRKGVDVYQAGDSVCLVCPMLDRNNDHMSIYLADDPETGGYVLTDIGATISDLDASGCDILSSESRREKLEQTLCGFGLKREGAELYVKAGEDNLFQRMNMLMQGMASVDDLFFTAKDSVRRIFLDDVADWLDSNKIRYSTNASFAGRSGFETKFDFVIPKTVDIAPERLIRAVGNPNEASIKNALFGWDDISAVRGNSKLYLFLDSTGKGEVPQSLMQACIAYNTHPVSWPEGADEVLSSLAA